MTKEEMIKEAWGYAWDFIDMNDKERIYHKFLLKLYENTMYGDGKLYDKLKAYYYNATNSNAGEEQKDLTKILEL